MKKFALGSIALLTLALGTVSVSTSTSTVLAQATKPKGGVTTNATIPPPSCPPHDPNGCGIYD